MKNTWIYCLKKIDVKLKKYLSFLIASVYKPVFVAHFLLSSVLITPPLGYIGAKHCWPSKEIAAQGRQKETGLL